MVHGLLLDGTVRSSLSKRRASRLTSLRPHSIVAHLFNATWLAEQASTEVGARLVAFLEFNFTTGPVVTGWIMTLSLAVMVWFAVEKRKKRHFERFWYSHHLFVVFFICWQLHGVSSVDHFSCRAAPLTGALSRRCSASSSGVAAARRRLIRLESDLLLHTQARPTTLLLLPSSRRLLDVLGGRRCALPR